MYTGRHQTTFNNERWQITTLYIPFIQLQYVYSVGYWESMMVSFMSQFCGSSRAWPVSFHRQNCITDAITLNIIESLIQLIIYTVVT